MRESTIEELASAYVKEMRECFPQGPYLLGGASFGGLVIFEMAKQLYAQGVEPGLIIMFDTAIPGNEEHVEAKDQVSTFWQNLRSEGMSYLIRKVAVKGKYWSENLICRAQNIACSSYRVAGLHLPTSLRYFEMEQVHHRALRRYELKPYPGKITLAKAIDRGPEILGKREDPTLGWGRLAGGGLKIIDVPTRHMFMLFEPYVDTFATMLKAILPS